MYRGSTQSGAGLHRWVFSRDRQPAHSEMGQRDCDVVEHIFFFKGFKERECGRLKSLLRIESQPQRRIGSYRDGKCSDLFIQHCRILPSAHEKTAHF